MMMLPIKETVDLEVPVHNNIFILKKHALHAFFKVKLFIVKKGVIIFVVLIYFVGDFL